MVVDDTAPKIIQLRIERLGQLPTWRMIQLAGEMNRTVRTRACNGGDWCARRGDWTRNTVSACDSMSCSGASSLESREMLFISVAS